MRVSDREGTREQVKLRQQTLTFLSSMLYMIAAYREWS